MVAFETSLLKIVAIDSLSISANRRAGAGITVYTDRMRGVLSKIAAAVFALILGGGVSILIFHSQRQFDDISLPEKQHLIEVSPKKIEAPAGWMWIDTRQGFSLYAPAGTQYHELEAIDWTAGEFVNSDFTLRFYLGYYPEDPAEMKRDANYSEEHVVIDARSGLIQREQFDDGRGRKLFYSHLFIRNAIYHYDYPGTWEALDLYGTAATPEGRSAMEKSFLTVQFDDRNVKKLEH